MTAAQVRRALAGIVVLGAAARVVMWQRSPLGAIHPDEIFQVVEPAWWRLHGAGHVAWEWREGIRSWVLPGYNGALMALLGKLGVTRGATIGSLLQLHWALMNLVVVGAAFFAGTHIARRLARLPASTPAQDEPPPGWQGGLLAAAATALFPLLITYAPHTLSELPSLLALTCGLTVTSDLVDRPGRQLGRAFAAGLLISLGICLRIANGPLCLVAPLWLLLRRRFADFALLIAGALVPVLLFGLVDLVTWGKFLGSFVGYVKFNFIEGRAAQFGTAPWSWYAERLGSRAPFGLALVLIPLLLGLRASWPFALSGLGLVALLSTQAHKEERFVIAFWPFALIGAAGVVGGWLARPRPRRRSAITWAVAAVGLLVLLVDNARHPVQADHTVARARLDAQALAGDDPHATGILVDSIFWSGGSLWWGHDLPQMQFDPALLGNRMITHVVADSAAPNAQRAREAGFVEIFARDGVVLLRRP
jgi:phosphatidylinositol glycan class B